jgi:hypothetical protein
MRLLGLEVDHATDDIALDELAFSPGGLAQGGRREAIEVPQRAGGGLMEHGDGVAGEELALAAGLAQADPHVLGGVVGREATDDEAPVDSREERSVAAESQPVIELGEADEAEGQERPRVPLVIEQDVQVVEHVLVEQVGLVEEKDGVHALSAEIFDVRGDGEEDGGSGGGRGQAEGETELSVEIAAAEGGIVAVGEAEARLGKPVPQGAQHARLAGAGLSGEQDGGVLVDGFLELVHDGLRRRREPQVGVGDLLGRRGRDRG